VLILRAGLGIGRTRTRAQVAHITGLRRARVAHLERRGLRQLRALGRAGACAVSPTATPMAAVGLPVSGPAQRGGGGPGAGRGDVLGERKSGTERPRPEDEGDAAKPTPRLPLAQPGGSQGGGSSFDFAFVFVPLAILAFFLVLRRENRRTT
jgi:hypothetical protein